MFTAIVLHEQSHELLLNLFAIPENWEKIAHHMTIKMGSAEFVENMLGQEATMKVVAIASNERVMAVQVETPVPSTNEIKHITLGVNRSIGGKPFHSNQLVEWTPIQPVEVKGIVKEVG
jgi:hypothetical protein